jgi:hypothetical protein
MQPFPEEVLLNPECFSHLVRIGSAGNRTAVVPGGCPTFGRMQIARLAYMLNAGESTYTRRGVT